MSGSGRGSGHNPIIQIARPSPSRDPVKATDLIPPLNSAAAPRGTDRGALWEWRRCKPQARRALLCPLPLRERAVRLSSAGERVRGFFARSALLRRGPSPITILCTTIEPSPDASRVYPTCARKNATRASPGRAGEGTRGASRISRISFSPSAGLLSVSDAPISRNNQAHLKDKSSSAPSFSVALQAFLRIPTLAH